MPHCTRLGHPTFAACCLCVWVLAHGGRWVTIVYYPLSVSCISLGRTSTPPLLSCRRKEERRFQSTSSADGKLQQRRMQQMPDDDAAVTCIAEMKAWDWGEGEGACWACGHGKSFKGWHSMINLRQSDIGIYFRRCLFHYPLTLVPKTSAPNLFLCIAPLLLYHRSKHFLSLDL